MRSLSLHRAALMVIGALLLTSGCVAHRVVPPTKLPAPIQGPDYSNVRLHVRSFSVTNRSSEDKEQDVRRLRSSFLGFLASQASYGQVLFDAHSPTDQEFETVTLDASIRLDADSQRTVLFDILFFYPMTGYFPFTPQWGDALVDVRLSHRDKNGVVKDVASARVQSSFSMLFYSWYRTAPIEEAFSRAYAKAFEDVASTLAQKIPSLIESGMLTKADTSKRARDHGPSAPRNAPFVEDEAEPAKPPPEPPREAKSKPAEPLVAISTVEARLAQTATVAVIPILSPNAAEIVQKPPAGPPATKPAATVPNTAWVTDADLQDPLDADIGIDGKAVTFVDEPGFHLRTRPREQADRGLAMRYLAALGGIELAYLRGSANVNSKARIAGGNLETVGSGNASSEGFKVSFFEPPDRTGFFFPPTLGFLSQTITIRGFFEDVPVFTLPGVQDIPAVASDPTTGVPVDAQDISYLLRLKSGFIGQQVGLNLVAGNEWFDVFGSVRGGLNLFEVRHTDVSLDAGREKGFTVEFLQSGLLAAQAGIVFPDIHFALRASVQFEWYLNFDYPAPIDFLAKSRFNPEKQIFERQRAFVEAASLTILNSQLSGVFVF